jgi:hypothetical protein
VAWGAKRQPEWYALKDGWWWAVVGDKLKWDAATAAGASLRVVVQYFYDPDDQWEVNARTEIRPRTRGGAGGSGAGNNGGSTTAAAGARQGWPCLQQRGCCYHPACMTTSRRVGADSDDRDSAEGGGRSRSRHVPTVLAATSAGAGVWAEEQGRVGPTLSLPRRLPGEGMEADGTGCLDVLDDHELSQVARWLDGPTVARLACTSKRLRSV